MLLPFTAGPAAVPIFTSPAGTPGNEEPVDIYADTGPIWVSSTPLVTATAAGPSAGTLIPAGGTQRWQLHAGDTLYAVAAAAGVTGRVVVPGMFEPTDRSTYPGFVVAEADAIFVSNLFSVADSGVEHGMPGLVVAFPAPGRPYVLEALCGQFQNPAVGGSGTFGVIRVKDAAATVIAEGRVGPATTVPVPARSAPINPAVGTPVAYGAYLAALNNGGAAVVSAWTNVAAAPMTMRAVLI